MTLAATIKRDRSGLSSPAAVLGLLGVLVMQLWPTEVRAQDISNYFPPGVAGYDQQLGVTVLSRLRPLYEMPGIPVGSFVISPTLDESLVYNSNVTGSAGSGSWGQRTTGSVSAGSDWVRDSLAGSIGFANNRFISAPIDDYTDWNVRLAGGLTIRDSQLRGAYSHQSYHELGTAIATTTSQTPVLDHTDTADVNYTFNFGPFSITPDVSASAYRFGTATVQGVQQNQKFLDRNVIAGGVTGRYSRNDEGGMFVVIRGITSNYLTPTPGKPSNNSNSFQLLGGIDYQAESVWRYRFLVGMEIRAFQAPQYPTHTAPLVEGSVIWTPTGLTTLTGTLSRDVYDPDSGGTNGYVLSQAHLTVDHEFLLNVFVQGRAGIQYAQFLQGGSGPQTSFSLGAGVTWLINQHFRLSFDYDFTKQTGSSNAITNTTTQSAVTTPYSQSVAILTLHFAL